jgi:hypothetical protein
MREYYKFLAIVRTAVDHDYSGNIENPPEPELPTRIAKSINRMIRIHAMIYGRTEVIQEDINFGLRIVYDNIPMKRLMVLESVCDEKHPVYKTVDISDRIKLSLQTTRKIIGDLEALRIMDHGSSGREGTNLYQVKDEFILQVFSILKSGLLY